MPLTYIETLENELADAQKRLANTCAEGKWIIMQELNYIKRDIRRNSTSGRETYEK